LIRPIDATGALEVMSWKLWNESMLPLSRYRLAAMSTAPAFTAASGTLVSESWYPACTRRLNDHALLALTDDVMKGCVISSRATDAEKLGQIGDINPSANRIPDERADRICS
jgi:hypothetical protein